MNIKLNALNIDFRIINLYPFKNPVIPSYKII